MTDITVEHDLSCAFGVGSVFLKLRGKFLYLVFMHARSASDTWFGEVGYATSKHLRNMAMLLKLWVRFGGIKADGRPVPFKEELPVYRYGQAYRDGELGDLDIEVNTDADSITVRVETVRDASYLIDTFLEMADRMDRTTPWR